MKGIDCDNLEKTNKKIIASHQQISNNLDEISIIAGDLKNCYKGEGLEFMYLKLEEQLVNLKNIKSIISNYTNVINQVIISYNEQNELLKSSISKTISNKGGEIK